MTTTPINSTAAAATPPQAAPKPATDPFANKNTFLQLLVAQLKNQDPLSPADGLKIIRRNHVYLF